MKSIFSIDSKFMKFLTFIGDLMLLNVLFVLFSLPVITAGASAAALYTMTLEKVGREEKQGTVKGFFAAFCENFKDATIVWLIFGGVGILLFLDYSFIVSGAFPGGGILTVLPAAAGVVWAFALTWVFAIQSKFTSRISNTIKNAVILAFTNLFTSLCAVILTFAPAFLFYFDTVRFIQLLPFFVLIIFSAIAYANSMMFDKVFKKLIAETQKTFQKEEKP